MEKDSRSQTLSLLAHRVEGTQAARDRDHISTPWQDELIRKRLKAERQAEFDMISRDNLGTPIESLPSEVLATIFEVGCLLPPGPESKHARLYHPPFEILVSSVSRRWRDVAACTPKLWTKIDIMAEQPLNRVTTYLARSGILPLDIRAHLWLNNRSLVSIGMILKAIMPCIARWRSMYIRSNHRPYLRTFLRRIRFAAAPLLLRLRVFFYDRLWNGDNDNDELDSDTDDAYEGVGIDKMLFDGNILTGGTPSLKLFRLEGMRWRSCMPPISTLSVLHIRVRAGTFSAPEEFRDVLDSLSILTHLVICGPRTFNSNLHIRPSILPMLSSLRLVPANRFTLIDNSDETPINLLTIISAPLLECLEIEQALSHDIKGPLFQSPEWTASSRYPRLRSLSLTPGNVIYDALTWHTLQRIFPTITEFICLRTSSTNSFSKHLVAGYKLGLNTDSVASPMVSWSSLQAMTLHSLQVTDMELLRELLSHLVAQTYSPLCKLHFRHICVDLETTGRPFQNFCRDVGVELGRSEAIDAGYYDEWYHEH